MLKSLPVVLLLFTIAGALWQVDYWKPPVILSHSFVAMIHDVNTAGRWAVISGETTACTSGVYEALPPPSCPENDYHMVLVVYERMGADWALRGYVLPKVDLDEYWAWTLSPDYLAVYNEEKFYDIAVYRLVPGSAPVTMPPITPPGVTLSGFHHVSISGSRLAFLARVAGLGEGVNPTRTNLELEEDAVFVYSTDGSTWSLEAQLGHYPGTAHNLFRLDFNGQVAAIGDHAFQHCSTGINPAPTSDTSCTYSGAVFTYTYDGSVWTVGDIIRPQVSGSDRFGYFVSLSAVEGDRSILFTSGFTTSNVVALDADGRAVAFETPDPPFPWDSSTVVLNSQLIYFDGEFWDSPGNGTWAVSSAVNALDSPRRIPYLAITESVLLIQRANRYLDVYTSRGGNYTFNSSIYVVDDETYDLYVYQDSFGASVDVHREWVLVGSASNMLCMESNDDPLSVPLTAAYLACGQWAAYLFERGDGSYEYSGLLKDPSNHRLGYLVSLAGEETATVASSTGGTHSAYYFEGGSWRKDPWTTLNAQMQAVSSSGKRVATLDNSFRHLELWERVEGGNLTKTSSLDAFYPIVGMTFIGEDRILLWLYSDFGIVDILSDGSLNDTATWSYGSNVMAVGFIVDGDLVALFATNGNPTLVFRADEGFTNFTLVHTVEESNFFGGLVNGLLATVNGSIVNLYNVSSSELDLVHSIAMPYAISDLVLTADLLFVGVSGDASCTAVGWAPCPQDTACTPPSTECGSAGAVYVFSFEEPPSTTTSTTGATTGTTNGTTTGTTGATTGGTTGTIGTTAGTTGATTDDTGITATGTSTSGPPPGSGSSGGEQEEEEVSTGATTTPLLLLVYILAVVLN